MRGLLTIGLILLAAHAASARNLPVASPSTPSVFCQAAIGATEEKLAIPKGLLAAIGLVETGRRDAALGQIAPWPWSINVAGEDHVFMTKAEAIAAVQAYQAQGVRSIDVGCVQVNLMYHPNAFASLDEAFDPQANVGYGGRFLKALFSATGTWEAAAGAYHSQNPVFGEPYRQRVLARWTGTRNAAPTSLNTNADVYGVWPPPGAAFAAMPPSGFAFRCCGSAASSR